MPAFGPKRTSVFALHMSAFGGKADIQLNEKSGQSQRKIQTAFKLAAGQTAISRELSSTRAADALPPTFFPSFSAW
jgi:hypothetical protein